MDQGINVLAVMSNDYASYQADSPGKHEALRGPARLCLSVSGG